MRCTGVKGQTLAKAPRGNSRELQFDSGHVHMIEAYASSWLFYAVIMILLTILAGSWAVVAILNQSCKALRRNNHASESNKGTAID